ncbi:hypothetical protein [Desulfotomaculum sp. 1211_IL3151]
MRKWRKPYPEHDYSLLVMTLATGLAYPLAVTGWQSSKSGMAIWILW